MYLLNRKSDGRSAKKHTKATWKLLTTATHKHLNTYWQRFNQQHIGIACRLTQRCRQAKRIGQLKAILLALNEVLVVLVLSKSFKHTATD